MRDYKNLIVSTFQFCCSLYKGLLIDRTSETRSQTVKCSSLLEIGFCNRVL